MCDSGKCCLSLARIVLIIFNMLFLLGGLMLMGIGIWLLVDSDIGKVISLSNAVQNSALFRDSAILILTSGCVLFVVSLLGFIGLLLLMKAILGVYIAIIIIVFCIEIAGAVLAIAYKDWLLDGLERTLLNSITRVDPMYYQSNNGTCAASSNGALWDFVQDKMNCCGLLDDPQSGYELLTYSLRSYCPGISIEINRPLTCCQKYSNFTLSSDNQLLMLPNVNCQSVKTQGCLNSLENWINHYAPILIGVGFGIAFLQVLGFIFAVCVCVNAPTSRKYKRQG